MWLSEQEVAALTRRKRPSAQIRILSDAGIPFKVVDKRPIVVDTALPNGSDKRIRKL